MNSKTVDDVELERKAATRRKSRPQLKDYVVTITQEHFVNVRAIHPAEAEQRALRELAKRWGGGHNPVVTEVELYS